MRWQKIPGRTEKLTENFGKPNKIRLTGERILDIKTRIRYQAYR